MQDEGDEAQPGTEDGSTKDAQPERKAVDSRGRGRTPGAASTPRAGKVKRDDTGTEAMISQKESVCTAVLSVPLDSPPLLMQELAESAAAKSLIRYTDGPLLLVLLHIQARLKCCWPCSCCCFACRIMLQ